MDVSGKTPIKYSEGAMEDLKAGEASSVHGSGEARGSWLKRMGGFIPQDYRNELVQLFKLAGPVVRLTHRSASKSAVLRVLFMYHMYVFIYIYIHVCVCSVVLMCVCE